MRSSQNMKTTGFLLLLGLMLFFYSDIAMAGLPIDCNDYPREICTMEYVAHCGAIRKTYANKCDFCNAFAESDGKLELEYYGDCSKGESE